MLAGAKAEAQSSLTARGGEIVRPSVPLTFSGVISARGRRGCLPAMDVPRT